MVDQVGIRMKAWTSIAVAVVALVALATGGFAAWQWLRFTEPGSTVASLLHRLNSPESPDRCDAATALGQVVGPGAERVAPHLIEAVRDKDPEVRARAAQALGSLLEHNPQVTKLDAGVEALAVALRDKNPTVRAWATSSLWALRRDVPGMLPAAIEAIQTGDPQLQSEATEVLGGLSIRDSDDVRSLLALLEDPATVIRTAARSALIRPTPILAPDAVLPALRETASAGSVPAREVAATMLGRSVIRVSASRDLLIRLLRDDASSVRLAAAAAMGAFSEDSIARMALRLAIDDGDLRVRATAAASLAIGRRATRAEALADLKVALETDPARRDLVPLIQSDPGRAAARLAEALRDRNPSIRAAAARCLGEVATHAADPQPVINALTLALTDFDPFVRRASAAALARFGPLASASVPALQSAVRDADRGVSGQALLSIKELESSRVK